MSIWAKIFGAGVGEVSKPIEAVGESLDKLFTSDEEKLDKKALLERIKQMPQEAQWEINKIEAGHASIFVAGWRPAIGWVCAASLGFYYIPQFIMAAFLWSRLALELNQLPEYPVSQISGLTELVFALLGLATLRTVEKARGVTK